MTDSKNPTPPMNTEAEAPVKPRRWTPLWLALATSLALAYGATVPAPMFEVPRRSDLVAVSVIGLLPVALLVLGTIGIVALLCGRDDARAGLRHLAGRAQESELPRAAYALGVAANWLTNLGLAVAAMAMLGLFDYTRVLTAETGSAYGNPANIAAFVQVVLLAVPTGALLGRCLLGSAAESAALRAGVTPPRFQTSWLFASLVMPSVLVMMMFAKFPTL